MEQVLPLYETQHSWWLFRIALKTISMEARRTENIDQCEKACFVGAKSAWIPNVKN